MGVTERSTAALIPAAILSWISDLSSFISRYRACWRVYRQTKWELSALTDRELSDIGIQRSDVARIAKEASEKVVGDH